jgi:hypothetical protein
MANALRYQQEMTRRLYKVGDVIIVPLFEFPYWKGRYFGIAIVQGKSGKMVYRFYLKRMDNFNA